MRLNKKQKESLLKWIAEGLQTPEINKRAKKQKPGFSVTRQQVDYYRKSRDVKIEEIIQSGEYDALSSGLAVKANRVIILNKLANKMIIDLLPDGDKRSFLWTDQVKGIGSKEDYERIDYLEFNKAEVDALRGVLDDIASEVGDRVKGVDFTSGGKEIEVIPLGIKIDDV